MVLVTLLNTPRGVGRVFLGQRENEGGKGPFGHVEIQKREVGHKYTFLSAP